MNSQTYFPTVRNIIVHIQVYIYICFVGLLMEGMIQYKSLLGSTPFTFFDANPGLNSHTASIVIIFLLALYIIRPPFYQVSNYQNLFSRLITAIGLVVFAMGIIELSWDLIFIKLYPAYTYSAFGATVYASAFIIVGFALGVYRHLNLNRMLILSISLCIYYSVWLHFGFPISTIPIYNRTETVLYTETGHWILGCSIFAWSIRPFRNESK